MKRYIIEQMLKVLWIFPIRKNRVVFRSNQGDRYICNPKYISQYLQENFPYTFEIVWIFNKPKDFIWLKQNGIKVAGQYSLRGIYYMLTAKFLVNNHGLQSYIPVRKDQHIVNTWHGGGSYKKPYVGQSQYHSDYMKKMSERTTIFLASCERFSRCNLAEVYTKTPEKILNTGMPRNDLFFGKKGETAERVRKKMGIAMSQKIILYAPTFRDNIRNADAPPLDADRVVAACERRFGGKFTFCVHFHRTEKREQSKIVKGNAHIFDGCLDMQELICISDVVVTDYSSLIWDVSIASIPCFIYATDLEDYMDDRGFYTPISEWPFLLAKNNEELVSNIAKFSFDRYIESVKNHHNNLGSYENGTACQQVARYMMSCL